MPQSPPQPAPLAHLQHLREGVEEALARWLEFEPGCPPRLEEAMRYAVLQGGKRLRPLLALLACEACGGDAALAMPAACAVEFVHAYSLVHDDLPAMDDDDLRRGLPTCHVAYDEATAILVGDALLARAFEVLATGIENPALAARSCATLAQAAGASHLVGGQSDDLAGSAAADSFEHLQAIHRRKTGAMIRASLALGGIAAGADEVKLAALAEYGRHFGLVFQITDDLLDAQGDAVQVGKRVGKDANRGKLTYPGVLGVEQSEAQAEELVAQACQAIGLLGSGADPLAALARSLLNRQS